MSKPIAMTIAGSDSGGGAGIQADLKTFAALGVHGVCAVTCITAQNPWGVRAIQPCTPAVLRQQMEAIFEAMPPAAMKTGMLHSPSLVRVVVDFLGPKGSPPLIIDPVMIAGTGTRLLSRPAWKVLVQDLLPRALLVTPNVPEAQILAEIPVRSIEDMREAARIVNAKYGCGALVKGGHLGRGKEASDIFFDGKTELLLTAPRVKNIRTHGTGCTYSAAIAAYLARGSGLERAVVRAKEYITHAIAESWRAGSHSILNHDAPRA